MIEQTPWFERKFDFNFPVGLFPVIVERLRGTAPRIANIVNDESDGRLSQSPHGAWSAKEQIGHLYDLEDLWYGRIEDFLAGEKILRAADLGNSKTHQANHNNRSVRELLTLFSHARSRLIDKVQNLDEATVSHTALHPRLQTTMRLIDSLFFVAEHDDHHLAKIRRLLEWD